MTNKIKITRIADTNYVNYAITLLDVEYFEALLRREIASNILESIYPFPYKTFNILELSKYKIYDTGQAPGFIRYKVYITSNLSLSSLDGGPTPITNKDSIVQVLSDYLSMYDDGLKGYFSTTISHRIDEATSNHTNNLLSNYICGAI